MKHTIKRTICTAVGAAMLAGTIGLAVGGTAFAAEDPTTPAPGRGDRAALVCTHLDEIESKLSGHLERIADRQGWLATRRAEAEAAGRDALVARIDRLSARLDDRAAQVQDRIDRLGTWAAEHCPAAT